MLIMEEKRAKLHRILKTAILYYAYLVFGLAMSLDGPCIPDLCARLGVTTGQLAIAFSVESVVWTAGSVLFGPLIDRFPAHAALALAVSLLLVAVCALKPLAPALPLFVVTSAVEALGYSGVNVCSNALVLRLWGWSSGAPLQGLHGAYSVGFALGPVLASPFLGPDITHTNNTAGGNRSGNVFNATYGLLSDRGSLYVHNKSMSSSNTSIYYTIYPLLNQSHLDSAKTQWNTTSDQDSLHSRIEVAYACVACLSLLASFLATLLWKSGRHAMNDTLQPEADKTEKQVTLQSRASALRRRCVLRGALLGLCTLFMLCVVAREGVLATWLAAYAVTSSLRYTKAQAARLDAAAKGCLLAGRVLFGLLSLGIAVQPLLFFETTGLVAGCACLWLWGGTSPARLLGLVCLVAVLSAPVYGSALAWTDRYVPVTGKVLMLFELGSSAGNFFFQWLSGWLLTNSSADSVLLLVVVLAAAAAALLLFMQLIASAHGARTPSPPPDQHSSEGGDTVTKKPEEERLNSQCEPDRLAQTDMSTGNVEDLERPQHGGCDRLTQGNHESMYNEHEECQRLEPYSEDELHRGASDV